jgi:hypothetical protein
MWVLFHLDVVGLRRFGFESFLRTGVRSGHRPMVIDKVKALKSLVTVGRSYAWTGFVMSEGINAGHIF